MSIDYYASSGAEEVLLSDISEPPVMLTKLAYALDSVGCWELVTLLHKEGSNLYILIATVSNSNIDRDNQYGIHRRETIGIEVYSEKAVPVVRVLREDFPRGMHTNYPEKENDLVSICLYTDTIPSVIRTLTAEKFLSRIEWWFESAAKGTLHPSEQPIEHPFFESGSEIVLPHEMRTRVLDSGESLYAAQVIERKVDNIQGYTFLTELQHSDNGITPFYLIQIQTPIKTDNTVRSFPSSLKGLLTYLMDEALLDESVLIDALCSSVATIDGQLKIPESENGHSTIVLVQIPLSRDTSQGIEKVACVAFLLFHHPLEILDKIGQYSQDPQSKIFAPLIGSSLSDYLESEKADNPPILPTHVLFKNSPEDFSNQSGLKPNNISGAIIGVGALGSCVSEILTRSGWGQWSYIDKDHVRPHNLTRHTSIYPQVGEFKASAVHQLACSIRGEHISEEPIVLDAITTNQDHLIQTLRNKQLVIDATTTLEYPRRASMISDLPRHLSIFLTPDSRSSVLLLEDSDRAISLAGLEAQYYREVISSTWGSSHLSSSANSFWSGNSCRDLSYSIPYSNVMTHASLLVSSVIEISEEEAAKIVIFEKDETNSVNCHSVRVYPSHHQECQDFIVLYDEGLIEKIANYRQASLPNETGGIILGYYDFSERIIVIVDCLPEPPDSKSSPSFFERGTEGVKEAISSCITKTMGNVVYLGEWHSHPPLSSSNPSQQDEKQLQEMTNHMATEGMPWIQLIIAESNDISITVGWSYE